MIIHIHIHAYCMPKRINTHFLNRMMKNTKVIDWPSLPSLGKRVSHSCLNNIIIYLGSYVGRVCTHVVCVHIKLDYFWGWMRRPPPSSSTILAHTHTHTHTHACTYIFINTTHTYTHKYSLSFSLSLSFLYVALNRTNINRREIKLIIFFFCFVFFLFNLT